LVRAENGVWSVKTAGEEAFFRPTFVIAGDGASSTVASLLGLPRLNTLTGLQVEAPLTQPLDRTVVFLDRSFVNGYGWLFPKGKVANVGIGATSRKDMRLSTVLDDFLAALQRIGMIRHGVLARTAGVIPVSGLRDPLVKDEVLFCGDAAGLTHPITGAGIPQAVVSGRLAGQAAVNALKRGDPAHLKHYEAEIRSRYQGIMRHALEKRQVMTRHWDTAAFEALCEETWIGFKGYRKRIRDSYRSSR
jgi:flavin-dependent dehydrogenase